MLVFDSRFTTYTHLSALNAQDVRFITLRRRGKRLLEQVEKLEPWKRIHIPHPKRKYPNPLVHESIVELRGYQGRLRQVVVRGNGREKPSFIITNDFEMPLELLVGNYARRWRVENGIAEAVKFFHLNALSSPILVKVHFDVVMTMIADTLYSMLAKKLRGFEQCDAAKLYRHFIQAGGVVEIRSNEVTITYPRRAHNPILRAVPWHMLPSTRVAKTLLTDGGRCCARFIQMPLYAGTMKTVEAAGLGMVVALPRVGGLRHRYARISA
jgi:hypothetical protein